MYARHYIITFQHNNREYAVARFNMAADALPSPFEYEGNVCTVMNHRLGNTYHVQFTGELLGKLLEWRIDNPDVGTYIPESGTIVIPGVHIGQVLVSKVIMKQVPGPLDGSRLPLR